MTSLIGLSGQNFSTTVTFTLLHETSLAHLHPHPDPVILLALVGLILSGVILYRSARERV